MDEKRSRDTRSTFGSLAYDLDALVLERRLDEAGAMPEQHCEAAPQPRPQRRAHEQSRLRLSPVLVGSLVILCTMLVLLIFGHVQLTTVSAHVSSLKGEIAQLNDDHVNLTTEYERTFDLATIKAVAEENGMSKPSSGQIEYIDLGGSDTAVVYADAGLSDNRLTASVSEAARWLWEYFR